MWVFRLYIEKDQEKEPEVTDQVNDSESLPPDYKEGSLVTCCDQSECMYKCLLYFENSWLVNICSP